MNQLTNFTTNFQERQLFLPMDLAKIIPYNDSVRVLSNILEVLNYSTLMQEYSKLGRNPVVNPKVLFKILVYAFMNNIYSSRQIEKACKRDINFMWLLQNMPAPSHNTISRFRSKRLANCMEDLFYQLILKLSNIGEIDFNNLFVDGTKIEANANKYTFKWKKSIQKYDKKLDIKIEELLNSFNCRNKTYFSDINKLRLHIKNEIFEANILFTSGKGQKKHSLQKDYEILEEYLKKKREYQNDLKKFNGRNSFSKTDNDATFMHMKEDHMRNSQLKPAYNAQISVSGEYITGAGIYNKRNDYHALIPFLDTLKTYLPLFKNIVADAGYESEENYVYLRDNCQSAYIKPQTYEKGKTRKFKNDISKRENMIYLEQSNEYICHNQRKLKYIYSSNKKTESGYIKKIDVYGCDNCSDCNSKSQCTRSKYNKKLYVPRLFTELREKSYENITSDLGIYLRLNRSIQVEGAFGVIKENRKFRQFLLRGTKKVEIEFLLICMAYNINKLHAKKEKERLGVAFHKKKLC